MADNRNEKRVRYLQALDERSRQAPWDYWSPRDLVDDYTTTEIAETIRYLEERGFIEAVHAGGDHGFTPARITADGQDFLHNVEQYTSDRTLGGLARAAITYNTTHITNSTIGNLASGGTGHTFSGTVSIINHPQASALQGAFRQLEGALADDTTLATYVKEEVGEQVQVVRTELAKLPEEQNPEKIAHRWERVSSLVAIAAPLLEIVDTITKLLKIHGG